MNPRGIFERPKGSGIWWINYYHDGRQHREKIGRKSMAVAMYQKRKTQIREGRFFPPRHTQPIAFSEIIDDMLEYSRQHKVKACQRDDVYMSNKLKTAFKGFTVAQVNSQHMERLLASLADKGRSPSTLNHYHSALSLIFRLAIRNGKATQNPAKELRRRKENNARVRFLDADEEAKLHDAVSAVHLAEIYLALNTGMRRGEQYKLRWENVDLERGVITIPRAKHGEKRHIPINSAARIALLALRRLGDGAYVSPTRWRGERKVDQREWFENAVKRAGIPNFRWHDLRHTFASRLVMAGVDLRTVQELMGHKNMTMTLRYAHLAEQHQKDAIERLVRAPKQAPAAVVRSNRTTGIRAQRA
jgi:integrase